ncbi:COMPASS (complex proteins associated with Set1p) component [Savitreella phatthalungensis]
MSLRLAMARSRAKYDPDGESGVAQNGHTTPGAKNSFSIAGPHPAQARQPAGYRGSNDSDDDDDDDDDDELEIDGYSYASSHTRTSETFEGEIVPPFPDLEGYYARTLSKLDKRGNNVYCICRRGDLGRWMIGCDACEEWYHGSCVRVSRTDEHLLAQFYCPRCERDGHGKTRWKRKCRLAGCRRATTQESKYCSRDHGVSYMRDLVRRSVVDASILRRLATESADDFRLAGTRRPLQSVKLTLTDRSRVSDLACKQQSLMDQIQSIDRRALLLEQARSFALAQNHALKAAKEKELCGYDVRFDMNNEDLEQAASPRRCEIPLKRCARHGGNINAWHSVKLAQLDLDRELLLNAHQRIDCDMATIVDDALRSAAP